MNLLCESNETAEWVKSIGDSLKLWDGAKARVVDGDDIPNLFTVSAYFAQSAERSTEDILKFVKGQNKDLRTDFWKILNRYNEGTSAFITLSVDHLSMATLKTNNMTIRYRIGEVTLRLRNKPKVAVAGEQMEQTVAVSNLEQQNVQDKETTVNCVPSCAAAAAVKHGEVLHSVILNRERETEPRQESSNAKNSNG